MFYCWYDIAFMKYCIRFTTDGTGHNLSSSEYFPKCYQQHCDVFFGNYETKVFFLDSSGFTSHGFFFYSISFLLLSHKHEPCDGCSSLGIVLGSFVTYWMSIQCTPGVILYFCGISGVLMTLVKVDHCSRFFSICG